MTPQQRTLSTTITHYYRQRDRCDIAEERVRLTRERIAELDRLLAGNKLFRSQGVMHYTPTPSGKGQTSDPTTQTVIAYEREFARYDEERTRLRLRETGLSQEIAEIRDQGVGLTKVLSYLTAVDRQILEGKYRFGKSNVQVALEVELDERTVRNHLTALAITIPTMLAHLDTTVELPGDVSAAQEAAGREPVTASAHCGR